MRPGHALLVASLLLAGAAGAHTASNSFLELTVDGRALRGSIEVAVRDVEVAVGVDNDGDGRITWGELRRAEPALRTYLSGHLALSAGNGACPLTYGALRVNARADGNYAWLPFSGSCPGVVRDLEIRYQLLSGLDPSHRGLLALTTGALVQTAVLGAGGEPVTLSVGHPDRWRVFRDYARAGTWHIWEGIDHLLFLVSLLLPAVLVRRSGAWQPVPTARPAFLSILKVVTAFTLAHSITLTLAALDVVRLPGRLTESIIAASIVVAALNNIFPVITESRARIAFSFGLLHGFGFASVLADMGLPGGARLLALLSFNIGIEAGQLAVVLAIMPAIYLMRTHDAYRRRLLPWGSAVIATLAGVWLVQRALL
jgi:hypothetical protein